jgi:hypothetical protein
MKDTPSLAAFILKEKIVVGVHSFQLYVFFKLTYSTRLISHW